jgi:hypothetical protein
MPDAFQIKIFVPDGDPEGLRIISRMDWAGLGIAFPRSKWLDIRQRPEFSCAGVYILEGIQEDDSAAPIASIPPPASPTIYIGQGDCVRGRIDTHFQKRDFWSRGIVCVSTTSGLLNRAHVTWLEYALLKQATEMHRCRLANETTPSEPRLSEAEKADTQAFLKPILQILPLVGLRAFEPLAPVATPKTSTLTPPLPTEESSQEPDTIIVPAQEDGFEKVFIGQDCWYPVRIAAGKLDKIKYIAVYRTKPVMAITHYAPVDRIEPYGDDGGYYRLIFSLKAREMPQGKIPLGGAQPVFVMGPKYTTFAKLIAAKKIADLVGTVGWAGKSKAS